MRIPVSVSTGFHKMSLAARKCGLFDAYYFRIDPNSIEHSCLLIRVRPHLECVATLPCDLSLITIHVSDCRWFSDVHILQCSVAMHLSYGGIFSYHFTANLMLSREVEVF